MTQDAIVIVVLFLTGATGLTAGLVLGLMALRRGVVVTAGSSSPQ